MPVIVVVVGLRGTSEAVSRGCSSDPLCNVAEGHPGGEQWQRTKLVSGSQAPLGRHAGQ